MIKYGLTWSFIFVCEIFIWQVCRVRGAVVHTPQNTAAFYSEYSEVLLARNKADLQIGLNNIQVEVIEARAKSALKKAPLSDKVFSQIASAHTLANQIVGSQDLFLEAQRRNRRNKAALISIVAIALDRNDILTAVYNSDILVELDGSEAPFYLNLITTLSESSFGREKVDIYLRKRPGWATSILSKKISRMNIDNISEVQRSLLEFSIKGDYFTEDRSLHESFIEKLMTLGAYDQAFSYWKLSLPEWKNTNSLIHDSKFNVNSTLLPFSWHFIRRPKYFAKVSNTGGLFASYNGRRQRTLVQQTLKLQPARSYRLLINAEWDYLHRQGIFLWQIECWPQKKVLVEVNMEKDNRNTRLVSGDFYVPEKNCDVQTVQLVGRPGQYSRRIEVLVKSVNISEIKP